jgi:hypothetical protein
MPVFHPARRFRRLAVLCAGIGLLVLAPALTAGVSIPEHDGVTGQDCAGCHKEMVSSGVLSPAYGPGHYYLSCDDCHDLHGGSTNRSLIWEEIYTPNSGVRTVVFANRIGPNSAADGDTVYDGVCEVCHTTSAYHRNDGSGTPGHHAETHCIACHNHGNGFEPYTTTCMGCHAQAQPQGAGEYRRQVVENAGDGGGDFVRTSHHVSDGSALETVAAGDCVICHDITDHGDYKDGVSVLLNDPNYGPSVFYDGTPDSLEAFCLACHDGTHTAPLSSGNPAADIASRWAGSAHGAAGASCGDCHGNGHGSDLPKILLDAYALADPAAYDPGSAALCWNCHFEPHVMAENNEFEDLHGLHVSGSAAPCVVCHDTHGPVDAGEPGLISFAYALSAGWDIQMIDGRDLSTAFYVSPDSATGFCYLRCHGQDHVHAAYARNFRHVGVPDAEVRDPGLRVLAFPSPSRGPTTIRVESPSGLDGEPLTAVIFDIHGRRIRELRTRVQEPGGALVRWNGRDASGVPVGSGLYLCRVRAGSSVRNARFVVLR